MILWLEPNFTTLSCFQALAKRILSCPARRLSSFYANEGKWCFPDNDNAATSKLMLRIVRHCWCVGADNEPLRHCWWGYTQCNTPALLMCGNIMKQAGIVGGTGHSKTRRYWWFIGTHNETRVLNIHILLVRGTRNSEPSGHFWCESTCQKPPQNTGW